MNRFLSLTTPLAAGCLSFLPAGCGPAGKPPPAGSAPAKVDRPVAEAGLTGVTLAPEAENRLGIATSRVERKPVARAALHGGDVQVPPGRSIAVSAPLGGVLGSPAGQGPPAAGARLRAGEIVFTLTPLWTPSERLHLAEALVTLDASRIDAEGAIEKARVEIEAAKIALARSEQLLLDKAGSTRAVDEAKARLHLAEASRKAAEARSAFLRSASLEAEGGNSKPLEIVSPTGGILMKLHTAPGEMVAQGAPLFDVAAVDELWVRVPIHAGDLSRVAREADAEVGSLSDSPGNRRLTAKSIASAPPSADPLTATVDLFYEIRDPAAGLVPGQRVAVTVRRKDEEESLILPWSAVLHDIHGGTWVYERVEPGRFVRRRVEVRFVSAGLAVLESGPPVGAEVVTAGAAELFGSELGFGK